MSLQNVHWPEPTAEAKTQPDQEVSTGRRIAVMDPLTKEADVKWSEADEIIPETYPVRKEEDVESVQFSDKSAFEPAKKKRWRRVLCCACIVLVGVIFTLGLIILILNFTIFRLKDVIILSSTTKTNNDLSTFNFTTGTFIFVTNANVSIHNPNAVSVHHENSTISVSYHGDEVGGAQVPAGQIKAHGDEQVSFIVKLDMSTYSLWQNLTGNLTEDFFEAGALPLVATTEVVSSVKALCFTIKNVRTTETCNISYFAANGTQNFDCSRKTTNIGHL
jgi:hypothetical protein